jgi:hypothetical protein
VGVVKVHSRMWRETALLRAAGGSVLEGISSELVICYICYFCERVPFDLFADLFQYQKYR